MKNFPPISVTKNINFKIRNDLKHNSIQVWKAFIFRIKNNIFLKSLKKKTVLEIFCTLKR